jgi:hypothetical protein
MWFYPEGITQCIQSPPNSFLDVCDMGTEIIQNFRS